MIISIWRAWCDRAAGLLRAALPPSPPASRRCVWRRCGADVCRFPLFFGKEVAQNGQDFGKRIFGGVGAEAEQGSDDCVTDVVPQVQQRDQRFVQRRHLTRASVSFQIRTLALRTAALTVRHVAAPIPAKRRKRISASTVGWKPNNALICVVLKPSRFLN